MKPRWIVLVLLFFTSICLEGRELSVDEALARWRAAGGVRESVQGRSWVNRQEGARWELVYTERSAGQNTLYVLNKVGAEGFVVLGADDTMPALVGYSENGEFRESAVPENLRWWMRQYRTNSEKKVSYAPGEEVVTPLLRARWGQSEPYNRCCDVEGERCLTGCVATAMAQVMHYHRWPTQGRGAHGYVHDDPLSGAVMTVPEVDFSQHTYEWDLMREDYSNAEGYTDAEAQAVATLMYDCGVSVDMFYGIAASGAVGDFAAKALYEYFDYDASVSTVYRVLYTDEAWEGMLLEELCAGRPVIYCGNSTDGGHCFVCDGYDGQGYFHFNWGWNGHYDGHFLVSGTDPLHPSLVSDGFTAQQLLIKGIQPQKGTEPMFEVKVLCNGSYDVGSPVFDPETETSPIEPKYDFERGERIYLTGNVTNASVPSVTLDLGMKFVGTEPSAGGKVETYWVNSDATAELDPGYFESGYFVASEFLLMNGQYRVYPTYRLHEAPQLGWKEVELPLGCEVPVITITGEEPGLYISAEPYFGEGGQKATDNKVTLEGLELYLELTANRTLTGRDFYVDIYPAEGQFAIAYMKLSDVSMQAGETRQFVLRAQDVVQYAPDFGLQVGNMYKVGVTMGEERAYVFSVADQEIYFTVVDEKSTSLGAVLSHRGGAPTVKTVDRRGVVIRRDGRAYDLNGKRVGE